MEPRVVDVHPSPHDHQVLIYPAAATMSGDGVRKHFGQYLTNNILYLFTQLDESSSFNMYRVQSKFALIIFSNWSDFDCPNFEDIQQTRA